MWHSGRVDEAELKALVRDQLGRQAVLVRGETRRLARALQDGETGRRVAMGVRGREGLLVLLTDRRLLLGHGWSPFRRRERVEAFALADLRGVVRHMMSVDLVFDGRETLALALAPEEQAHALTDALRAGLGLPDAARVRGELRALAERKLGGRVTSEMESDIALLADHVEADEDVQRLAFVAGSRTPLLAAITDRRLVVVHAALRGHNDRVTAWPREAIGDVTRRDDTLLLDVPGEEHGYRLMFMDPARCDEFEAVLG